MTVAAASGRLAPDFDEPASDEPASDEWTGAVQAGDVQASTAPAEVERPVGDVSVTPDRPWIVIVWNDPINLMSYVTWVFQKLFGYPRAKAEKLMMDVHTKGKAVVTSGPRESCEADVARLHAHGLWATLQQD